MLILHRKVLWHVNSHFLTRMWFCSFLHCQEKSYEWRCCFLVGYQRNGGGWWGKDNIRPTFLARNNVNAMDVCFEKEKKRNEKQYVYIFWASKNWMEPVFAMIWQEFRIATLLVCTMLHLILFLIDYSEENLINIHRSVNLTYTVRLYSGPTSW